MNEVFGIRIGGGRKLANLFKNETFAAFLISDAVEPIDHNEDMSLFISSIPEEFFALKERSCLYLVKRPRR
jgi:hypothetical protein